MAKKARFFKVSTKDGFGDYWYIYAAGSRDELEPRIRLKDGEKLTRIKHLGHRDVQSHISDNDYTYFTAFVEGVNYQCYPGNSDYSYLQLQFSSNVNEHNEFFAARDQAERDYYNS